MRISVPLELVTLTSGGKVVTDYEPSDGDVVAVWLRGSKSYRYTPAIEGNVLRWEDNGELWCGCYDLEVRITQADGTKLRAYHTSVLSVVNETSVVTDDDTSDFLAEGAELDAAIFEIAKGDKGDPGTTDYNELENKPDLSGIERNASAILALAMRMATAEGQIARKQDMLVSGENIKTVNNQSLLGSGDITIEGGGGISSIKTVNGISLEGSGNVELDGWQLVSSKTFYPDGTGTDELKAANLPALPTSANFDGLLVIWRKYKYWASSASVPTIYGIGNFINATSLTFPQKMYGSTAFAERRGDVVFSGNWQDLQTTTINIGARPYDASVGRTSAPYWSNVGAAADYFKDADDYITVSVYYKPRKDQAAQ